MEKLKNYQKPATKTVKLSSQHMIAGTGNENNEGASSRELRSVWKDDEE